MAAWRAVYKAKVVRGVGQRASSRTSNDFCVAPGTDSKFLFPFAHDPWFIKRGERKVANPSVALQLGSPTHHLVVFQTRTQPCRPLATALERISRRRKYRLKCREPTFNGPSTDPWPLPTTARRRRFPAARSRLPGFLCLRSLLTGSVTSSSYSYAACLLSTPLSHNRVCTKHVVTQLRSPWQNVV